MTAVFSARALTKTYRMGETEIHALRGVDLEILAGEFVYPSDALEDNSRVEVRSPR